jgi:8-oxo-dGTP pyrophosphatase MutT (NUDIX family)
MVDEPRPAISAELDRRCGEGEWRVVGASALVYYQERVWFEITRPRYWFNDHEGRPVVALGGIGGSVKAGETAPACLRREGWEELNAELSIQGAAQSRLVYDGQVVPGSFDSDLFPRPWFYTAGRNRRPASERDAGFLVIVSFQATASRRPEPHDLYGLLAVPEEKLCEILTPQPAPLNDLCRQTDSLLLLNGELPADARLRAILTAESARLLLCDPAGAGEE